MAKIEKIVKSNKNEIPLPNVPENRQQKHIEMVTLYLQSLDPDSNSFIISKAFKVYNHLKSLHVVADKIVNINRIFFVEKNGTVISRFIIPTNKKEISIVGLGTKTVEFKTDDILSITSIKNPNNNVKVNVLGSYF